MRRAGARARTSRRVFGRHGRRLRPTTVSEGFRLIGKDELARVRRATGPSALGGGRRRRAEEPMKSILDPSFRYVPSTSTDLRKTFSRVRREIQRARAQTARSEATAQSQVI